MTIPTAAWLCFTTITFGLWAAYAVRRQVEHFGWSWHVAACAVINFVACPVSMIIATMYGDRQRSRRVVRTWDAERKDTDDTLRELEAKLGRLMPQLPPNPEVTARKNMGNRQRFASQEQVDDDCLPHDIVESQCHRELGLPGIPQPPLNRDTTEGRIPWEKQTINNSQESIDPRAERCQRCGVHGSDRRNLWITCLVNLMESTIPFTEYFFANNPEGPRRINMLRICKDCRAEFIATIERWHASGLSSREANVKT